MSRIIRLLILTLSIIPVSSDIIHTVYGKPTLDPLVFHACPNESVTFTCSHSQITLMEWRVEPYTDEDDEISYIPSQMVDDPGPVTMNSTNSVLMSQLVHFSKINETFANITTKLTVRSSGVRNGTNITCTILTGIGSGRCDVVGILHFAGNVLSMVFNYA